MSNQFSSSDDVGSSIMYAIPCCTTPVRVEDGSRKKEEGRRNNEADVRKKGVLVPFTLALGSHQMRAAALRTGSG